MSGWIVWDTARQIDGRTFIVMTADGDFLFGYREVHPWPPAPEATS